MIDKLDDHYWSIRYSNNSHRWDLGKVSNPIKEYIDQIENKNLRILIPGSGNAYEADYLLESGFTNITCIDISKVLVSNLNTKFEKYFLKGSFKTIHGDFFDLKGNYDLIIEQTFFCALSPDLRQKYCLQMNDLLSENGKLVGLLFDRDFDSGPPFGGHKAEYFNLFSAYFKNVYLENCYNSEPERQGTELWIDISI